MKVLRSLTAPLRGFSPPVVLRKATARCTSQRLKDIFHIEALTTEVRKKREAASAKMYTQGLRPEDSYDFLDARSINEATKL